MPLWFKPSFTPLTPGSLDAARALRRRHQVARNHEPGVHLDLRATMRGMMKRRYGRIVCISSGAREGTPWTAYYQGGAAYSAAKAGVIGFTRHLALEVGADGLEHDSARSGQAVGRDLQGYPKLLGTFCRSDNGELRALRPVNRRCKLEISGGVNRPPMERNAGVAMLFERAVVIARDLGWKLTEAAVGGGSDGNFTAGLGIPTLDGLGGVGDGARRC